MDRKKGNNNLLSNSLRKFFDAPQLKTASNPNELYGYLDKDNVNFLKSEKERLKTMVRERQFGYSGTIPPLRYIHPNRFKNGSQIIITNDLNLMVEPQSISRLKYKNSTKLYKILHDDSIDAALKIGIGEKDRENILNWIKNDKYKEWKADSLMNPKTRRILHKLDVIRKKTVDLQNKNEYIKQKQEWMIPKTHPHGIIGIDTPLLTNDNDTIYYKKQINDRKYQNQIKKQISIQRKNRIQSKENINCGLLYHDPKNFKHKLNERPLLQKKRAFKKASFQETNKNIFEGVSTSYSNCS